MKDRLFELILRDHRKLNAFVRTCDGLCVHSDTALFKVKRKGVYIMLTDYESFCCVEARITDNLSQILKTYTKEFTTKIRLDSLVEILKRIDRAKNIAMICATQLNELRVLEILTVNGQIIGEYVVESTEHRDRVFHILSSREFQNITSNYVQFRIMNIELNRIITMLAIGSGINGGVCTFTAEPDPIHPSQCKITFAIRNDGGFMSRLTIHTVNRSDVDVPVQHIPQQGFQTKFFVTYLKKSQNLLHTQTDYVTLYANDKGMLLQTDIKDHHSVLVFMADLQQEDLSSYC